MKIVKWYSATEINIIAGIRLEGTAFPVELYAHLQAINVDFSKYNDPVLLVGSIKTRT